VTIVNRTWEVNIYDDSDVCVVLNAEGWPPIWRWLAP
jgi:hypothetical protein